MSAQGPLSTPGAHTTRTRPGLAGARAPVSAVLRRTVLGSMVSASLVVGAVMAASQLLPAPPRDTRAQASSPLEDRPEPANATRTVSPLVELAFAARRRRRHLPLGAALDTLAAIAAAAPGLAWIARVTCLPGCACRCCSSFTARPCEGVCEPT